MNIKGKSMNNISRRNFLHCSTAIAAGAALPDSVHKMTIPLQDKPSVKRYKPFGKTGFMVGDISAGAGQTDPGLVDYIFERGINFIDTGIAYGDHELVIGKVLPKFKREKLFICTKWDPYLNTPDVTKAALMEALDKQLKRLNTPYVDCMMVHSYGDPDLGDIKRIQNPAIYEAFDEAKKLGKIRYSGGSCHSVNILEETEWALDNNRFDVLLLGANFLTKGLEPLLKRARSMGVATVAMKTMTIYKTDINIKSLMNKQTNARQAVLKYMLASDLFDTHIIGMRNYDQVNEYLSVSGTTSLTTEDEEHLETLSAVIGPEYCRPGCNACYGACPNNVPVWDILRYKMYFEHYGDEKYAIERYGRLPEARSAAVCADCSAPCEDACRYNLAVRDKLITAHNMLTLA